MNIAILSAINANAILQSNRNKKSPSGPPPEGFWIVLMITLIICIGLIYFLKP
jgi:hypothetical protein